ncbi:hypothetical protein BJ508DRAFT_332568 [Ascobolus immersus RN42]|uniref:Uncharacterized protein n=1 Tax=Ascobolus immersus RN42 TaxID=1160509 RepID=A0A3N4HNY4_ASCIM|nr:hypothetical protein BJ508DRAFT_332568 [Ascobolus immersus RN42]
MTSPDLLLSLPPAHARASLFRPPLLTITLRTNKLRLNLSPGTLSLLSLIQSHPAILPNTATIPVTEMYRPTLTGLSPVGILNLKQEAFLWYLKEHLAVPEWEIRAGIEAITELAEETNALEGYEVECAVAVWRAEVGEMLATERAKMEDEEMGGLEEGVYRAFILREVRRWIVGYAILSLEKEGYRRVGSAKGKEVRVPSRRARVFAEREMRFWREVEREFGVIGGKAVEEAVKAVRRWCEGVVAVWKEGTSDVVGLVRTRTGSRTHDSDEY